MQLAGTRDGQQTGRERQEERKVENFRLGEKRKNLKKIKVGRTQWTEGS